MTVALCLACDVGYLPFASVVAKRALALASRPLPVVIICDEIPSHSLRTASSYIGGNPIFVDASSRLSGLSLNVATHITKAAYLRLFVDLFPEMAHLSKVLYVDCDVEFLRDPYDLIDIDLAEAPILAAYDWRFLSSAEHRSYLPMPDESPYFNSGVLLLDLDRIRREGQLERARRFASDFPLLCRNHDQDALNVGFAGKWQTMDWRWNVVSMFQDLLPHDRFFVRHFTRHKPWGQQKAGIESKYIAAWREALRESPWPDSFQEMSAVENFGAIVRPFGHRLEMLVKQAIYGGAFGKANSRRERRVRLASNFKSVLKRIEDDARELRLARQLPEYSLID